MRYVEIWIVKLSIFEAILYPFHMDCEILFFTAKIVIEEILFRPPIGIIIA